MSEKDCAFCETEKLAPRIIHEGKLFISFLSNPRIKAGHTLVIPRRHVEIPKELTSGEKLDIMNETTTLTEKILGGFAIGTDVWQKTRPNVDETGHKMNHLHYHVLPSNPGDELYDSALNWGNSNFETLTDDERDRMINLLK